MHISYSQVVAYRKCPASHYYGYVRRLKPKTPIKALQFGSNFHSLLEFRADPVKRKEVILDIKEKADTFRNDLGDDYVENIQHIFQDYTKQWKGIPLPNETEHRFCLPMGTIKGEPVHFVGVIDEIYREGDVVLGEHKTFGRQPSRLQLIMDLQTPLYAKAYCLEYGVMPKGIQWDHICSTSAVAPVWLEKSDRFSGAKTNKVTEWSYLRACKERGIEPDPILLEDYRNNNSAFFFRTQVEVNPRHVERCYTDFRETVRQIVVGGQNNTAQYFSRDCSFCKFKALCYAETVGADVEDIINLDYVEKERHHDENEEDSNND